MIEGGYVVTNYHVVWPYEEVTVVFPGSTELSSVPVIGWDPIADIAVLGPVDVEAGPLKMEDGEDAAIGSELYLVGYPAEVDDFPQPSITRGVLSRFREWEPLGMTYFQTDAAIAGGQSGGALVGADGQVIGISGLAFSEASFGLAASLADAKPIVSALIENKFAPILGDRRLPVGTGEFEHKVSLHNYWDTRTFLFHSAEGTIIQAQIEGEGDGWFHISDAFGSLLEIDDDYSGIEHGSVEIVTNGPHFLQIELASGDSSEFELSTSVRLQLLSDPDDGQEVMLGDTIAASLDHFTDYDWYSIYLNKDETIKIATNSFNVDTIIYVDFPASRSNQAVHDDDSGEGLFGVDAELTYRAPHTGEYFIVVASALEFDFGGYYLTVESARTGTETVTVPSSPRAATSPFGQMIVFEDLNSNFSIQVPAHWIETEIDPLEGELFAATNPSDYSDVAIGLTYGLSGFIRDGMLTTEYLNLLEAAFDAEGAEEFTKKIIRTSQDQQAIVFEISLFEAKIMMMVYALDSDTIATVAYGFLVDQLGQGRQLANYSFGTFYANQFR